MQRTWRHLYFRELIRSLRPIGNSKNERYQLLYYHSNNIFRRLLNKVKTLLCKKTFVKSESHCIVKNLTNSIPRHFQQNSKPLGLANLFPAEHLIIRWWHLTMIFGTSALEHREISYFFYLIFDSKTLLNLLFTEFCSRQYVFVWNQLFLFLSTGYSLYY